MTSIAMKISDMSSEQIAEKLYKIILIGDPGVGKTSFMQRYVRNAYPVNYKMTVGGRSADDVGIFTYTYHDIHSRTVTPTHMHRQIQTYIHMHPSIDTYMHILTDK